MKGSRLWLALVVALFCLPLFVGLGRRDLANDEAIYSFAVDSIVESGDWLDPKLSPDGAQPFLEKPPLKFWIVAAPIAFGLLPHDEFGQRFWDACFGGVAFVYVFLIGSRLINATAGVVAVLSLFGHSPLLFEHGLRDNTMEAPLVLSYCGAVYHFLAWNSADSRARRTRHAVAVGLFFVLGFMVKFVAALFLPAVLAVAVLALPAGRSRFFRDWRVWAAVAGLVVLLIAPWFVYAHRRYGSVLWNTIAGEHVYRRFTASLDPGHLQPWYYYFLTVYQRLSDSGVAVLAAGGLGVLAWQVYARRRLDALIVVLWAMIPMVLMSLGTSKLYHYAYPFLPAFALAVGYLVALLFALAPAPVERWVRALHAYAHRRFPRGSRLGKTIPFRMVLVAGIAASLGLAAASIALGQIRVELADGILFRSTGIFRPSMVALLLALPLGLGPRARRVVLPLVIVSFLPLPAYRASLVALTREDHPYRSTIECISRVDEGLPGGPRGLYVAWPHHETWHPVNYYFRRVQPWEYDSVADAAKVAKSAGAAGLRPVLIWRSEYQKLPASLRAELATHVDLNQKGYLILPGPYGVCDAGPIFR